MKLICQQADSDITKLKLSLEDAEKQWDATVSECTRLTTRVNLIKVSADKCENSGQRWQIIFEAHAKYTNHIAFLLGPHMKRLSEDIAARIYGLPVDPGIKETTWCCLVDRLSF